jgi:hydrogenase maturation protease
MSPRILIAGIGNVLLGDDGFGFEVLRGLGRETLPVGVEVKDYGVRGLDLAYRLLDPPELLILVDAIDRDAPAGTLFLVEPEEQDEDDLAAPDPHRMTVPAIFRALRTLGRRPPRTQLLGCKPAELEERIGLSSAVQAAVRPAIDIVLELVDREMNPVGHASEEDSTCGARIEEPASS